MGPPNDIEVSIRSERAHPETHAIISDFAHGIEGGSGIPLRWEAIDPVIRESFQGPPWFGRGVFFILPEFLYRYLTRLTDMVNVQE